MTQLLIPKELERYAEKYTSPESKALAGLNRETHMKVPMAVMLSGHIRGAILQMISHFLKPKYI